MDIDSWTRSLAQSCRHPLSGLGSINVEAVGRLGTEAKRGVMNGAVYFPSPSKALTILRTDHQRPRSR
ncbi:hypothetical protein E4U46_006480 [Claviceps purpurea]|nr:hypothetical protein E4U46_006480 [Claviceps purpurea]